MSDSKIRAEFEAYWRTRQLRTHRYTDRECPEDWGLAFKADAEAAWQAARQSAMEEAAMVCEDIASNWVETGATPEDCANAIRQLAATPDKRPEGEKT